MRHSLLLSIPIFTALFCTTGCFRGSGEPAPVLVWIEEGVEHEGLTISLGHHGDHLHAGEPVEPAAAIIRDGESVADVMVFNSLVSADGGEVIAEEVATVYKPPTSKSPARYAEGKLPVPQGAKQCVVRFRIVQPGNPAEFTRDITIEVE